MHYVILDADVIGEVMRGERTTLPVSLPAEPGKTIGLKTAHHRKATCLMDIAGCDPDEDGYLLHLRPHTHEHSPMLLMPASRPKGSELGYTDKPYLSMVDEPEAVDTDTQDRLTLAAIGRDAKRRREHSIAAQRDRQLLTVLERIMLAKTTAAQNGISIHAEVKAITRMQERGRSDGLIEAELERVERLAYREAA